jgi:SNF2 family DNA or RNA helicase
MDLSPHQAKYLAHALTLQHAGTGMERLSQALFNASVELNPHQIDAAVFALQSPLSQGVLLADEAGLGKTIEAAIVLCRREALLIQRMRQTTRTQTMSTVCWTVV